MQVRDYSKCANRCMIDCRANLRGGQCIAPFKEVPAPTVATDNSGEEEETYDCIHCNGTGQHSKPGLAQLTSSIASPVEEEHKTAEQWLGWLDKRCHFTSFQSDYVFMVLKELTRKS